MAYSSYPNGLADRATLSLRLPKAPSADLMWSRVLVVASVLVGAFLLDRLSALMLNYWLLDSMGYAEVFWTNFRMQSALFAAGTLAMTVAVALPAALHGLSSRAKSRALWIGLLGGLLLGYELNGEYLEFLGPLGSVPFGASDPIFDNDISFYVFDLPPIRTALQMSLLVAVAGLLTSILTALAGSRELARPEGVSRLVHWMGRIATPSTRVAFFLTGLLIASLIWLRRYWLLVMPNFEDSTEDTGAGAEYVDIVGFFSTKNAIYVEALAVLALTIGMTLMLGKARRAVKEPGSVYLARAFRPAAFALVLLPGITADLTFRAIVAARDNLAVIPNEPVIQLPYLQRHIDATHAAFGLDAIDERTYVPPTGSAPLPALQDVLDSPSVRNAPLWSGQVSRYSRRVAPHYVARILAAEGDMTVYAPTLEVVSAQETLRPYYGFMDVDTIVSEIDGELTMLASMVRELPQDIMRPWLVAWGQRSILFTHGHGLVTLLSAAHTAAGDPVYGTSGVPIQARFEALKVANPSIYYGEGAVNAAFSNAVGVAEHDVASEQGRIEVQFDPDLRAGIEVDGLLKRLVIGYRSGQLLEVLFSDLIDEGTRAHVFRRPIERVEQLAPFLELDTDPYAVPTPESVHWMVNAFTISDAYPYSAMTILGDPSDLRTEWRPFEPINYIRDSVKASIDALTGQVTLYRFDDEPVINTWAQVYPSLFRSREDMPEPIRAQVQYPPRLMGVQFNKIYPFYHPRDALTFYSGEDLLDDADEVVGPILGTSGAAITFSQGLYNWIAEADGPLPAADPPVQFALSKTYTPQDPLNLRAIATAYQTGDGYGQLSVLKIPKGMFFLGAEQADAAIDQDAFIAQEIGLWNRLGVEVIRGRTSLLLVEGEAIYVEPIFIRSRQNPIPQLQRVVVVMRGKPHMGRTLDEALTFAIEGGRLSASELTMGAGVATGVADSAAPIEADPEAGEASPEAGEAAPAGTAQ